MNKMMEKKDMNKNKKKYFTPFIQNKKDEFY